MTKLKALDLFAGTGWGVACKELDIEEFGVEIMAEAVATRTAAGMTTVYRDVWDGLLDKFGEFTIDYDLLIASPPCQTFSVAGKGAGRAALDQVLAAIDDHAYEIPELLHGLSETLDARTALVLTPLAHVYRDRPEFVVLEQVPTVLPVWEACAEVMRGLGYSVVTGVLNAEQYGVPQTRKRAILVARRDGVPAAMPTPTHSRYYSRTPDRLDEGVLPWVSMAEALGWGMTERPYPTVATGTENGGTDPAALGGSGARKTVYAERSRGAWVPSGNADNDGGILRLTEVDAAVIQTFPPFGGRTAEEVEAWGRTDIPATTVAGDPRLARRAYRTGTERQMDGALKLSIEEAAILQSFPVRPQWVYERPAPTLVGTRRSKNGMLVGRQLDDGSRQDVGGHQTSVGLGKSMLAGVRVSGEEGAHLQTFPTAFPFQGGRGKVFLQIGNAVPPLLARAILSTIVTVVPATVKAEGLDLAA